MRQLVVLASLLCLFLTNRCCAWSEGGHHLISVMAFDRLTPECRLRLIELLKSHPRFAEDFETPEKIEDLNEKSQWLTGRAAYWPDIARKTPFDRPNWHWQLGASMTIGDPTGVPANPGPVPDNATLASKICWQKNKTGGYSQGSGEGTVCFSD